MDTKLQEIKNLFKNMKLAQMYFTSVAKTFYTSFGEYMNEVGKEFDEAPAFDISALSKFEGILDFQINDVSESMSQFKNILDLYSKNNEQLDMLHEKFIKAHPEVGFPPIFPGMFNKNKILSGSEILKIINDSDDISDFMEKMSDYGLSGFDGNSSNFIVPISKDNMSPNEVKDLAENLSRMMKELIGDDANVVDEIIDPSELFGNFGNQYEDDEV